MEDVKKYGAAGTLSYVITVHGFGIFQDGLGGGFKYFLCSPLLGEDEPILTNIFQMG